MKTQIVDGMSDIHFYLDIRHNCEGRVVGCTREPHFTPREVPSQSFPLEGKWSPGLLNADRRIRSPHSFSKTLKEQRHRQPL